jgi:tetratricopeptide (TPR) repeat protein
VSVLLLARAALAGPLDEMSLERWAKLREAERYQLNIAEKYYREQNWKVALAEYEKFLTLYERSEGAPYAQLKWSLCQVQLRKLNTAIKDGYQSVIDYWPNSPEAIASRYFIARTYKDMGETQQARKAYAAVLMHHPRHLVAVLSRVDLIDMARVQGDQQTCVKLWRELVFDTDRTDPPARQACIDASQQLAAYYFSQAALSEAIEALATTYQAAELPAAVAQFAAGPLATLASTDADRPRAARLADEIAVWIQSHTPQELNDTQQRARAVQCWYHVADVYAHARRPDKVREVYTRMEQLFGVDDALLDRIAAWHKGQGQYDEARAAYRRFQDQLVGEAKVAGSYREERKYDLAVQTYQSLAGRDTDHAPRWLGEAAMSWREAQKWDEAIAIYIGLLQSDPEHVDQWQWQLAVTYRDAGRYQEAIQAFRLCENFPDNYVQMAGCHRALAEWDRALALYHEIAVAHEPSAPWAMLQVAYTQEQAGRKEQAIRSFQQVCRRFPKTSQASEAHAHLQTAYKITTTLGGATEE